MPRASRATSFETDFPEFVRMVGGAISCPACTIHFKDIWKAKRHFESIHTELICVCEFCGTELKRKDKMKNHLMKKHHLESYEAKMIADRSQKMGACTR